MTASNLRRRVAYTIEESPLGFEHHSGSMSVEVDDDGRTVIAWITDFLPSGLEGHLEPLIEQGASSMTAALATSAIEGRS